MHDIINILKTENSKDIVKLFSDKVNNICFDSKEFVNELKESQEMKYICYSWIKKIGAIGYRYDGRNEYSVKTAKKLLDVPFIQRELDNYSLVPDIRLEEITYYLTLEHRTLQQSFSSVAFSFLYETATKSQKMELFNYLGSDFFITPYI